MKQEDLIKKLENLKTPEIELPGHRQALRVALLNSGHFKQRSVMDWAKILAPMTAAVALIVVMAFFNVIQPQLQIARAKEITMNDPYVQALIEEHKLDIAGVQLRDGGVFVLLAPPIAETYRQSTPEGCRIFKDLLSPSPSEEELFSGYILKVDLLEKRVSEFGEIDEVTALRDINLEDIDFVKLEPAETAAPEEADLG
jgi:hypothetical protein